MIKKIDEGFTLLEIIITLTVLAIMLVMMLTFFGNPLLTGLTQGSTPMLRLQNATQLQAVMEKINYDYDNLSRPINCSAATGLAYLQNRINTPSNYGTYTYTIVWNGFMQFNPASQTQQIPNNSCNPSTTNILQVTISDPRTGESLTNLFPIMIP